MDWYRKRTLGTLLDEAADRHADREALVFEDRRWRWADLKADTDRVAKGLIALGIAPGDRVALWMTNRPEWVFLMFAIAKVGACLVPLNTRYRTDDLAYTVNQSRSGTLIALDRSGPIDYQRLLADSLGEVTAPAPGRIAASAYPSLERVVILGDGRISGALTWEDLLTAGRDVDDTTLAARGAAVDPDSLMMIAYTSGTTGHPKGVMHTHIPIRSVQERAQLLGLTMTDVHMNYLPLFHIYAFSEIAMVCAISGGKQVLMDQFEPERALDLAAAEGATVLHGFEAHWLDLLSAQARRPRPLAVRIGTLPSGTASTIPVAERVQDAFCPTVSGFGMSETWAYISCSNPAHTREQRVCASGYPMNDYEFRVIEPGTGMAQPCGTPGELLVRGYAVMKGYWDNPQATAETLDAEGWVHTGDMAYLRPDGHLVFMGRYKDMLKVGGENVSPAEVEAWLRGLPDIHDAAVVAYPDPRLAEVPVAFIIPKPGATLDAEAVVARMKGRLASFKIPRHVLFVEAFPMTSSGKIRKVELRARARELLDGAAP